MKKEEEKEKKMADKETKWKSLSLGQVSKWDNIQSDVCAFYYYIYIVFISAILK